MNKRKTITGIIIFIIIVACTIGVSYYLGVFDNILNSEEKVLTDREYIEEIIEKMTYNEDRKIKSYIVKSSIIEEGTEYEEEITEVVYDGINNTYKEVYKVTDDNETEEYTTYKQKDGGREIEYRQDYDIETKEWYREVDILTADSEFFYDEIWSGGIDFARLSDAADIEKIEENVYVIEFDNKYMKQRSENLYEVGDKATGKLYINDGYITKIEMDATNFHLKENMTKRTVIIEILNINNTTLEIPQDVINSAKDIPQD